MNCYTANEIAASLGIKRQAVRWHLRGIAPAGVKVVRGNEADAWEFCQLPAALQKQLEAEALNKKYRNVEALIATPRKQWQPPFPLDKICEKDIQIAIKLRDALLPWLYGQHDKRISSAEMDTGGVNDYRRIFGSEITARYWRELFNRTIQRDNGFEEWNRLEIYLPQKPKAKETLAKIVSRALSENFEELEIFIASCGNPHDPSETERAGIWTLTLEKFTSLTQGGDSEKQASRQMRNFLFARAKFLVPTGNRNALRMAFERKLEKWRATNGDAKALRDCRNGEHLRYSLPESDRDKLIAYAVRGIYGRRGDVTAAWRNLLRRGEFSEEVCARYKICFDKSYVPASVMDSVSSEVEILSVMQQGPRAFDSIKGHVTRSYDGIHSLQCVSGDDFTLNTYFNVPDGKGWFDLTRGQVILFIDFRTSRILGWALEPRKSYSSLTIRSICTNVFSEFGVPQILYFERGIWKSATLLKGKTDPFTFTEISQGLREFGIQFKHAIRPRTKTVERIGGMFQSIAEAEPGYCGRDERRDAPESLRRQMAEVKARKVHPSKYFYSLDQWNHRIGELVEQYNSEPQQGHLLAGLSPDQALEAHIDASNPPIQFNAGLRYLLAHDKRLARVTLNGVTIQVGKQKFNYRGQEIAHLVGRDVLAWFDPENHESIVVTNPDRTNPICVALSEHPNALESLIAPESGLLASELERIEGQASYMKTRYNVVKAKFPLPQRKMLATAQTEQLGAEIAAQKTEVTEAAKRQRRQRGHAQRFTQRTRIAVPEQALENFDSEGADLVADFLAGNDSSENIATEPDGSSLSIKNGKTYYHLKPFKGGKEKQ